MIRCYNQPWWEVHKQILSLSSLRQEINDVGCSADNQRAISASPIVGYSVVLVNLVSEYSLVRPTMENTGPDSSAYLGAVQKIDSANRQY
jgi:hypothetical protein